MTLTVPLAMLNQIPPTAASGWCPACSRKKVTALLRTVPQKHRHRSQPVAERGRLRCGLRRRRVRHRRTAARDAATLRGARAVEAAAGELPPENLEPALFHMNFRVHDEHGRLIGQSRNLMEPACASASRWRALLGGEDRRRAREGAVGGGRRGRRWWPRRQIAGGAGVSARGPDPTPLRARSPVVRASGADA